MPLGDVFICPYCGNPNPNVKRRMKGTFEMKFDAGSPKAGVSYDSIDQQTPLINCKLCDRKYYLYAQKEDADFCKRLLNKTVFHETVYEIMKNYGLSPGDIVPGFEGLTQVKSITSCINGIKKRVNWGDEIHLIFSKEQMTYFITLNNSNHKFQAINLGVA
jgi:hypothetical protein